MNCSSAATLAALATTACTWASTPVASHRTTPERRLPPAATLGQRADDDPRGLVDAAAAAALVVADVVLAII